jgi:hypothetical protein
MNKMPGLIPGFIPTVGQLSHSLLLRIEQSQCGNPNRPSLGNKEIEARKARPIILSKKNGGQDDEGKTWIDNLFTPLVK